MTASGGLPVPFAVLKRKDAAGFDPAGVVPYNKGQAEPVSPAVRKTENRRRQR